MKNNFLFIVLYFAFLILFFSCSRKNKSDYEEQLEQLRHKFYTNNIEAPSFFLFGMGNRNKYVYKHGALFEIFTGKKIFGVNDYLFEQIHPEDYTVIVFYKNDSCKIIEEENGVFIINKSTKTLIPGTGNYIKLPTFEECKYDKVLKVLHHEILINILNSKIYPNILVYKNPWYRDAAMATMCLEKTGNLFLIKNWVLCLNSIYDLQSGISEADNLGQLLYLLSKFPERRKTFVDSIIKEVNRIKLIKDKLTVVSGLTDGQINETYQTNFLLLALKELKLKDTVEFSFNSKLGPYFDLTWFTKSKLNQKRSLFNKIIDSYRSFKFQPFPYLQWARAHYYHNYSAPFSSQNYPLSWESGGSESDFTKMIIIDSLALKKKITYTHLWTSAEMFLYLFDFKKR